MAMDCSCCWGFLLGYKGLQLSPLPVNAATAAHTSAPFRLFAPAALASERNLTHHVVPLRVVNRF